MLREALSSQRAAEGRDEGAVDGLAGPADVQQDGVALRPGVERARRDLAAVVRGDPRRQSAPGAHTGHDAPDVRAAEARLGHEGQALPGVTGNQGLDPHQRPVGERVVVFDCAAGPTSTVFATDLARQKMLLVIPNKVGAANADYALAA